MRNLTTGIRACFQLRAEPRNGKQVDKNPDTKLHFDRIKPKTSREDGKPGSRLSDTLKERQVHLFSLEDVPQVFQPDALQELVDGHVEQRCRDTQTSHRVPAHFTSTTNTHTHTDKPHDSYLRLPSCPTPTLRLPSPWLHPP